MMNGASLQNDVTWLMGQPGKFTATIIVLIAIGLVAVAIEYLRMRMNGWLALVVVSVVLLVMALLLHPAWARDDGRYAQSPLKGWFDSFQSKKGPCCSDADGSALSDTEWESRDGRYRVKIEGNWYDVPEDAVLTQPNLYGRTMVWPIFYRSMGKLDRVEIRCFIPGSMI